jgi:hypothetical protein
MEAVKAQDLARTVLEWSGVIPCSDDSPLGATSMTWGKCQSYSHNPDMVNRAVCQPHSTFDLAMLIHPMFPHWFMARRCVWPRHGRSIERSASAYGIGICSLEEIGSLSRVAEPSPEPRKFPLPPPNGNGNGSPRVQDRLCQLIRQHSLDPELVKAYATDFCGTKTLRDATRAQVENFVEHLADWAEKDRNALLCQLNSYPARAEKGGKA